MTRPTLWDLALTARRAGKTKAYNDRYPTTAKSQPAITAKQPVDTSMSAHHDVQATLNDRQRRVLEAIATIGPCCNQQIAEYLHAPINTITPRCNELREMGKVELAFKAPYTATGRTVCHWRRV